MVVGASSKKGGPVPPSRSSANSNTKKSTADAPVLTKKIAAPTTTASNSATAAAAKKAGGVGPAEKEARPEALTKPRATTATVHSADVAKQQSSKLAPTRSASAVVRTAAATPTTTAAAASSRSSRPPLGPLHSNTNSSSVGIASSRSFAASGSAILPQKNNNRASTAPPPSARGTVTTTTTTIRPSTSSVFGSNRNQKTGNDSALRNASTTASTLRSQPPQPSSSKKMAVPPVGTRHTTTPRVDTSRTVGNKTAGARPVTTATKSAMKAGREKEGNADTSTNNKEPLDESSFVFPLSQISKIDPEGDEDHEGNVGGTPTAGRRRSSAWTDFLRSPSNDGGRGEGHRGPSFSEMDAQFDEASTSPKRNARSLSAAPRGAISSLSPSSKKEKEEEEKEVKQEDEGRDALSGGGGLTGWLKAHLLPSRTPPPLPRELRSATSSARRSAFDDACRQSGIPLPEEEEELRTGGNGDVHRGSRPSQLLGGAPTTTAEEDEEEENAPQPPTSSRRSLFSLPRYFGSGRAQPTTTEEELLTGPPDSPPPATHTTVASASSSSGVAFDLSSSPSSKAYLATTKTKRDTAGESPSSTASSFPSKVFSARGFPRAATNDRLQSEEQQQSIAEDEEEEEEESPRSRSRSRKGSAATTPLLPRAPPNTPMTVGGTTSSPSQKSGKRRSSVVQSSTEEERRASKQLFSSPREDHHRDEEEDDEIGIIAQRRRRSLLARSASGVMPAAPPNTPLDPREKEDDENSGMARTPSQRRFSSEKEDRNTSASQSRPSVSLSKEDLDRPSITTLANRVSMDAVAAPPNTPASGVKQQSRSDIASSGSMPSNYGRRVGSGQRKRSRSSSSQSKGREGRQDTVDQRDDALQRGGGSASFPTLSPMSVVGGTQHYMLLSPTSVDDRGDDQSLLLSPPLVASHRTAPAASSSLAGTTPHNVQPGAWSPPPRRPSLRDGNETEDQKQQQQLQHRSINPPPPLRDLLPSNHSENNNNGDGGGGGGMLSSLFRRISTSLGRVSIRGGGGGGTPLVGTPLRKSVAFNSPDKLETLHGAATVRPTSEARLSMRLRELHQQQEEDGNKEREPSEQHEAAVREESLLLSPPQPENFRSSGLSAFYESQQQLLQEEEERRRVSNGSPLSRGSFQKGSNVNLPSPLPVPPSRLSASHNNNKTDPITKPNIQQQQNESPRPAMMSEELPLSTTAPAATKTKHTTAPSHQAQEAQDDEVAEAPHLHTGKSNRKYAVSRSGRIERSQTPATTTTTGAPSYSPPPRPVFDDNNDKQSETSLPPSRKRQRAVSPAAATNASSSSPNKNVTAAPSIDVLALDRGGNGSSTSPFVSSLSARQPTPESHRVAQLLREQSLATSLKTLTVKAVCTFLAEHDAPFDPSDRKMDLIKQGKELAELLRKEEEEEQQQAEVSKKKEEEEDFAMLGIAARRKRENLSSFSLSPPPRVPTSAIIAHHPHDEDSEAMKATSLRKGGPKSKQQKSRGRSNALSNAQEAMSAKAESIDLMRMGSDHHHHSNTNHEDAPSASWTMVQLRAFAEERSVSLSPSLHRTKAAVLEQIQKSLSRD